MNKDEIKMIKEMAEMLIDAQDKCELNPCNECEHQGCREGCWHYLSATELYKKGGRIVAEDEIVIKKQAYEKFVEEFAKQEEIAYSYEQGYTELLETNHQLQDELEKTKQETAREILREILYTKSCEDWFENEQLVDFGKKIVDKIENLAQKYGIGLED